MNPQVQYILSLAAIRERAQLVGKGAQAGQLNHFDMHESRMDDVADFVASIIKRDFGPDRYNDIPPHGRWQHFEVGNVPRIADMLEGWSKGDGCDDVEVTRRLIDLFFVSVLLDAGAGDNWRWTEPGTERTYERSEGIAVASLYMFKDLAFTTGKDLKSPLVDGRGLENLSVGTLAKGFQISGTNPMLGVESRANLLNGLGKSLLAHADVFGEQGRPGNIVDYMKRTARDPSTLDVLVFWGTLQNLLIPIWPHDRTTIAGYPIGDAWPLHVLSSPDESTSASPSIDPSSIQPFHKLTQWLTYSLLVPFQRVLNLSWSNTTHLTALAEYRNGGLFVDLGALTLKESSLKRGQAASGTDLPLFKASDDVIIEWRAMTLVLVDRLYDMVLARMDGVHLSMAQLLEAGTWKSGREIAAKHRPKTKSSPILIESDGTVF